MFGHKKYIYIWLRRYYENLFWCGDTVAILKSDIFHCSDSLIVFLTEQIYKYIKRSRNLNTRFGQNKTKKCYVSLEIWIKDFRHSIGGHFKFGH